MGLQIENAAKREKARLVNAVLRAVFYPFLRRTRHRKNKNIEKKSFPKILLIRPSHIGDVIMFTPALRSLRRRFPHAEITLLAGHWGEPVLRHNPHINRVIYHDCHWWRKSRGERKVSLIGYFRDYMKLLR